MQGSYYNYGAYRIDQQNNRGFDKEITYEDGSKEVMRYCQLAVQRGTEVYASVVLPAGKLLGRGFIRKMLYTSLEQRRIITVLPSPRRLRSMYSWVGTVSAIMVVLATMAIV